MTSKSNHIKHPPLVKPNKGFIANNEWGIYGAPCSTIDELIQNIAESLSQLNVYTVDADHQNKTKTHEIASMEWRAKSNQNSIINDYDQKLLFDKADLCLINGNHYPAKKQIVIIDSKKEESLRRRESQLTDIRLILRLDDSPVYSWLKPHIPDHCETLKLWDLSSIRSAILEDYKQNRSSINALILAGGKSTRMGTDKSQLNIHGSPQEIHLATLCQNLGLKAFISKSKVSQQKIDSFDVIEDRFLDLGPFGALLSAFLHDPNKAWLVLACDLPNINESVLQHLLENRNPSKYATALQANDKEFPEPLITIYEPKSYQRLLQFLSLGYSCPRKMLINSDVKTLLYNDQSVFLNLNFPEDLKKI